MAARDFVTSARYFGNISRGMSVLGLSEEKGILFELFFVAKRHVKEWKSGEKNSKRSQFKERAVKQQSNKTILSFEGIVLYMPESL